MDPYSIDEDFLVNGLFVFKALHERYHKRARCVYQGRNRNVFDLGNYVVKIPKNADGDVDNDWEGSVSNIPGGNLEEVQYARTRLAYWNEVPVVFMEKVDPASSEEIISKLGREPDWVWSVDGGQVGFTRSGRLVAYDYGAR